MSTQPSFRRYLRALCAFAAVLCGSCQARPPDSVFRCGSDRQCPVPQVCNLVTQRCVYSLDGAGAGGTTSESAAGASQSPQTAGVTGAAGVAGAVSNSAGVSAQAGMSSPSGVSGMAAAPGANAAAGAAGTITNIGGNAGSAGSSSEQVICTVGEKRCTGSTLETCAAGASGWTSQVCEQGCNATLRACHVCDPNDQTPRCTGNERAICRPDGTGYLLALCSYGCADSKNCKECSTTEHACDGACFSNDDPGHCGSSCTACAAVAHGAVACVGGACQTTCEAGSRACQGSDTATQCAPLAWDFEDGADGWEGIDSADIGADDANLVVSSERAHGGSSALRLQLAVAPMRYRVATEALLCGDAWRSGVDLRGTELQSWVYISTPNFEIYNTCLLFGRDSNGNNIGATNHADVPVNQWFLLRSSTLNEAGAASASTINLDCTMRAGGETGDLSWNGALYFDDIRIQ